MSGTVVIDCFPESAARYKRHHAIVAIDVIRATTTATTALACGRRVFPAQTTDEAVALARTLDAPMLVGELGGHMPVGFDVTNSPAQVAILPEVQRPMVLVSSSGTQLILSSVGSEGVYVACLRNYAVVACHLAGRHQRIAVLGAGTRGQFRREDQLGCALVAKHLFDLGYFPENHNTEDYVHRWTSGSIGEALTAVQEGNSADYLRRSGQLADLDFVLTHVNDLSIAPRLVGRELLDAAKADPRAETASHLREAIVE
jgi:2-phosphosulfolactate phosphatase